MRIVFVGDFNAPKCGNIDHLLIDRVLNVERYNKTRNIYDEQKEAQNGLNPLNSIKPSNSINSKHSETPQKVVRLVLDRRCNGLIGKLQERNESNGATIWIYDGFKAEYGLNGKSIISIKGTAQSILVAIHSILETVSSNKEKPKESMIEIVILIDSTNIDSVHILNGMESEHNVQIVVSPEMLPFSTEKLVNLKGDGERVGAAMKSMICRLFEDSECVETERVYSPQIEFDAHFEHKFVFEDCYHSALRQCIGNDDEMEISEMDSYFERIQKFPTFGDGAAVGAMDFMYFTASNMEIVGISRTLNEDEALYRDIGIEVERIRKSVDEESYHYQQGLLSKVLPLPNATLVSDHLPVAAVFRWKEIEHGMNEQGKCPCFAMQRQRVRSKINKNKKKKGSKGKMTQIKDDWKWYEMKSF